MVAELRMDPCKKGVGVVCHRCSSPKSSIWFLGLKATRHCPLTTSQHEVSKPCLTKKSIEIETYWAVAHSHESYPCTETRKQRAKLTDKKCPAHDDDCPKRRHLSIRHWYIRNPGPFPHLTSFFSSCVIIDRWDEQSLANLWSQCRGASIVYNDCCNHTCSLMPVKTCDKGGWSTELISNVSLMWTTQRGAETWSTVITLLAKQLGSWPPSHVWGRSDWSGAIFRRVGSCWCSSLLSLPLEIRNRQFVLTVLVHTLKLHQNAK